MSVGGEAGGWGGGGVCGTYSVQPYQPCVHDNVRVFLTVGQVLLYITGDFAREASQYSVCLTHIMSLFRNCSLSKD
jgi:hypothetical protein